MRARSGAAAPVDNMAKAAALIASGMSLLAVSDNFVRIIAQDLNIWQFHALRAIAAAALIATTLAATRRAIRAPASWLWLSIRSLLFASSMVLFFAAITVMPIAAAAAGLFTAPLFVILFAALMTGERLRGLRIGAAALGFAGALAILDPFAGPNDWRSALAPASGAAYGLVNVITRWRCRDDAASTLALGNYAAFTLLGAAGWLALTLAPAPPTLVEAAPFLFAPAQPLDATLLGFVGALALASVVALIALARAYQIAETTAIAPLEYVYIPLAALVAFWMWGEAPAPQAAIGVALMIASGVLLSLDGRRPPAPRPKSAA